jgi:hypothetical protein
MRLLILSTREPDPNMYVLIDFDNLPDSLRRGSVRYVADRVWASLQTMAPTQIASPPRIEVRLYGGWLGSSEAPVARIPPRLWASRLAGEPVVFLNTA